ncbi:hypothetical protein GQ55_6G248600 [Panicum hallii var. hallii]|uniref:Uncharacterized protein n=1 Tax=Panicum hallii var. hallii TaxID=1504633 RepID=A0A2T7D998_9POAL|nr:hypothetical protein GQ55_6G248600 [Panicum hallii var. hallii]
MPPSWPCCTAAAGPACMASRLRPASHRAVVTGPGTARGRRSSTAGLPPP